jgi:hypothetical protein
MSLFGGHGVIEDFSSLPRLLRDATVNELWEGPRNVLLMQVFRDLDRVKAWYPPEEFVSSILEGVSKEIVEEFAETLREFLDDPPFFQRDEASMERAGTWETFWDRLFRVYQERALDEVGAVPIIATVKIADHFAPLDIPEVTRKRQIGG